MAECGSKGAMPSPALLAALLLSAPGAGPSFPCARASTPEEQRICAVPELARLDRRLAVLYSWAMAAPERAQALRDAQRAWLDRRHACAAVAEAGQADCLRAAYEGRIRELEPSVGPVPDAILVDRRRHRAKRPGCAELSVSWPELVDSPLPGAARLNARYAPQEPVVRPCPPRGKASGEDGDEDAAEEKGWTLVWHSERFVTIDSHSMEMPSGAAHPMSEAVAATFDLATGQVITAGDVLAATDANRRKLAAAVRARLQDVPLHEEADEAIRKAVFDDGHWIFDGAGAALRFQQYEVTGYAGGFPEARFTWAELRPYLREGSPLPPR